MEKGATIDYGLKQEYKYAVFEIRMDRMEFFEARKVG